ncbi:MAG: hypothetical protein QXF25_02580, partial [Candidatus Pacearchaeota archaeon]
DRKTELIRKAAEARELQSDQIAPSSETPEDTALKLLEDKKINLDNLLAGREINFEAITPAPVKKRKKPLGAKRERKIKII